MRPISRRAFGLGLAAGASAAGLGRAGEPLGGLLPPWTPGTLDIHHIDTGRGNATFILAPDGTTLLIDCGASSDEEAVSAPPRPDGSRRPGEWVADYALRHARAAGRTALDYFILTHIHPDHVSGARDVDRLMPADLVLDRGFPDYAPVPPPDGPFADDYGAWLEARRAAGRNVARLDVGSVRQIQLRSPADHPNFQVRVLASAGRLWTGHGEESRSLFPDLTALARQDWPTENMCSAAFRLSYGRFGYFTGGDLGADTRDGRFPWMDVESPVVGACGQVEVAVADHHGYFDSCGPEFVAWLDAAAYVIPAWHVTHPGPAQLQRLLGAWPGLKHPDVFATEMLPANQLINARFASKLSSREGHVVVRVAPGGDSYRIFVLDSTRENAAVQLARGPYACRPSPAAQLEK